MFLTQKERKERPVALIQLPFPSQSSPNPVFTEYYDKYSSEYRNVFPEYRIAEGDLWEAPLWVAHIDGAIGREDTVFLNHSRSPFSENYIGEAIISEVTADHILFFSPLAQNFSLCVNLSRYLLAKGYVTVIGGNMSDLASNDDFSVVFLGLAREGIYDHIIQSLGKSIQHPITPGRIQVPLGYRPNYRHIAHFTGVPLARLNASHGCLYSCTFCGDAWSKQLHLVEKQNIALELADIKKHFPHSKLLYIGDKTFGQSTTAVTNLLDVITPEMDYRLIVQTHVALISEPLIEQMKQLGVAVVEMGFETASSESLKKLRKPTRNNSYQDSLKLLNDHGIKVILNVLGGLPYETEQTADETLAFLDQTADETWLYNIYNFVPYPKTPLFPQIRSRIFDWNFANWREDMPPVYEPYYLKPEQSWEYFLQIISLTNKIISNPSKQQNNNGY